MLEEIAVRFYTTNKLGPSREKTPEGYLLCRNVPIARTGMQLYGPGETPIESADAEGAVRVHRTPEQVFRPETIASFNGKPLVVEHPDSDVTTANWNELMKGVFLDPHRGVGAEDDLLLADLIVYDPETIKMIEDGEITEVSAGYDAGYVADDEQPGVGYQVDILGNHVALVRNGRCGPRCSIRDDLEGKMSSTVEKLRVAIRTAFKTKDEKALDAALSEIDDKALSEITDQEPATHIHIHSDQPVAEGPVDEELPIAPDPPQVGPSDSTGDMGARFDAIERELSNIGDRLTALEGGGGEADTSDPDLSQEGQGLTGDQEEEEKEEGKEEKKLPFEKKGDSASDKDIEEETSDSVRDHAHKVTDSRYMEESVQATVASAEILTPGIELPDLQVKNNPKDTVAALTSLRKRSLSIFASTTDGANTLADIRGGKVLTAESLKRMTAHDTRALFFSAATHMKDRRNRDRSNAQQAVSKEGPSGKITSIADMNKRNREFWANR